MSSSPFNPQPQGVRMDRTYHKVIPFSGTITTRDGEPRLRVWPSISEVPIGTATCYYMKVDPITGNITPYGRFTALVCLHDDGSVAIRYRDARDVAHEFIFVAKGQFVHMTRNRGGTEVESDVRIGPASAELIGIMKEELRIMMDARASLHSM